MTSGPTDGPFVVLLVGLLEPDRESTLAALDDALPSAEAIEVDSVREAMKALRVNDVGCVLVGSRLADEGWEPVSDELRRAAPHAALIALPDSGAVGHGWDDIVRPGDRDPRLLGRVLRSARAIARANERLTSWALRDPLTDVLNRRGLERVLVRETSALERGQGPLSALLVDCDDFKRVNDVFGLAAGDQALKGIAEALVAATRAGDTVARVGGDEFLVLLPQTRTWEAVEVAERIRERVREEVRLPDGSHLSVSIGARRLDEGVTTVTQVVGATQDGLKLSKAGGKDLVRVVDRDRDHDEDVGPMIDPDLSLPPGARLLAFRSIPVFDLATGEIARIVARVALDTDRRMQLGAQRAAQSAWDLHWFQTAAHEVGTPAVPAHLRLFPMTLMEVPTRRILDRLPPGFVPPQLVLALDEQFLSGDPSALAVRLEPLRAEGVQLCVDASDLGRSCLESLVLLRPEVVHVAPALVRGVASNRGRRAALLRFVQVADALDVRVLTPGIDVDADRVAVTEIGARYATGEVFATGS